MSDWRAIMTPPEGHPGQHAYTFLIRILSSSLSSVSIFSVCCFSSVSISMVETNPPSVTRYIENDLTTLYPPVCRASLQLSFQFYERASVSVRPLYMRGGGGGFQRRECALWLRVCIVHLDAYSSSLICGINGRLIGMGQPFLTSCWYRHLFI